MDDKPREGYYPYQNDGGEIAFYQMIEKSAYNKINAKVEYIEEQRKALNIMLLKTQDDLETKREKVRVAVDALKSLIPFMITCESKMDNEYVFSERLNWCIKQLEGE